MIDCVIIDDERLARERIKNLLNSHQDDLRVIGETDNGIKGIALIEKKKPQLLFLDIQMPDMSGFEMLSKLSYHPRIIFTTAYSEYAIEAFENHTIDYLVKPISEDRFSKSISKLLNFQASPEPVDYNKLRELISMSPKQKESFSFAVKKGNKFILLDYEDITYFKGEDKYVSICLYSGDTHITDKSLNELENTLPDDFVRIHRSTIVNKSYIREVEKYFKGTLIIFLNDKAGTKLKSSEKYSKDLKQKLGLEC